MFDAVQSLRSNIRGERGALLKNENEADIFDDVDDPWNPNIDSVGALLGKTKLIHGLVTHATILVMLVAWNAMVPLLLAQTLKMDSVAIGVYMAYNGMVLFAFTWWAQPWLM